MSCHDLGEHPSHRLCLMKRRLQASFCAAYLRQRSGSLRQNCLCVFLDDTHGNSADIAYFLKFGDLKPVTAFYHREPLFRRLSAADDIGTTTNTPYQKDH